MQKPNSVGRQRALRVVAATAAIVILCGQAFLIMNAYAASYSVFVGGQEGHQVVGTVTVGDGPLGVAVNPTTNRIYVANAVGGTVSVIDGTNNSVIATVFVGDFPQGVAVNPTTNRIYVANALGDTVFVINGTNSIIAAVSVDVTPRGVAVNPTTNRIYVANQNSDSVSVISNTYTDALAMTDSISASQARSQSISEALGLSDSIAAVRTAAPAVEDEEEEEQGSSGGGGGGGGNRVVIVNPQDEGPSVTTYPESHFEENPLDRISIVSVSFNANDSPVEQAQEGEQVTISAMFSNHQQEPQDYVYLLQVRDSGVTIHIGIVNGTIQAGGTTELSTLWTVPSRESFEVVVFVISSLDSPEILSDVHSSMLDAA